jgi:hypothetical protein
VTGPNGKSIFLPAAGVFRSSLENQGTYGSYWASTLSGVEGMADAVDFISGDKGIAAVAREYGLSVRPLAPDYL